MKLGLGRAAAVVTGLLFCIPAWASIPVIEGEYASTTRVYCQPTLNIGHSRSAIGSVILSQIAPTSYAISLEHYDPKQGTVKVTGDSEAGTSLLLNDEVTGASGDPFADNQVSQTVTYANDLTSMTINGVIYHAVWGLRLKNVVQYFVLLNIDANGCVEQSEKVRR